MNNLERLGHTLDGRMKKTSGAAVQICVELGQINGNMSLTTDSLQSSIPKGDYMIDLALASKSYRTDKAKIDDKEHDHALPDSIRGVQAGDRVLVAWCGNEPVVVAIVVSS